MRVYGIYYGSESLLGTAHNAMEWADCLDRASLTWAIGLSVHGMADGIEYSGEMSIAEARRIVFNA